MDDVISWSAKATPVLISIPMAIFGVQHFIYLQFVADFIPAWIPWRTFWACFTGVALIASALGILLRIWDRWAATLLGAMIFLWVVLLHTSRIAGKPSDFNEWRGIFQALAMSGCAFVLAQNVGERMPASLKTPTDLAGWPTSLFEAGAKFAPYFIGISMTALGLEHFIFAQVSAPQVPVWIPGTAAGNYLSGTVLFLLGVGICLRRFRRWSSALLGFLILLSIVMVHAPVALRTARFESDWTKTFVLSGGAFLMANCRKEVRKEVAH